MRARDTVWRIENAVAREAQPRLHRDCGMNRERPLPRGAASHAAAVAAQLQRNVDKQTGMWDVAMHATAEEAEVVAVAGGSGGGLRQPYKSFATELQYPFSVNSPPPTRAAALKCRRRRRSLLHNVATWPSNLLPRNRRTRPPNPQRR